MWARTSESSRLRALFAISSARLRDAAGDFGPAHHRGDLIGVGERRIGGGVARIELDGAPEQLARLDDACALRALQGRPGAQHVVIGFETLGRLGGHPPLLDLRHADRQGAGDLGGDLLLQGEEIGQRLVEAAGPQHPAVRIDELRRHPHAVAGLQDAALDLIANRRDRGRSRRGLRAGSCREARRSMTSRSARKTGPAR